MVNIYSYFTAQVFTEEQVIHPQQCSSVTPAISLTDHLQSQLQSVSSPPQHVNKINIHVKCAGKSVTVDVFPLESISVLLKEACERTDKKPDKMALVFDGNVLDVNKTVSQYPNLRGGITVNLIRVC